MRKIGLAFIFLFISSLFATYSAEANVLSRRFRLPTLTLVKTVINNDGGTKILSDFILKIDRKVVKSGIPEKLLPGKHKTSEVALPGYSASAWGGDCAPNGSIILKLGQNAICTITNDDVLAALPSIVQDNFNSYSNGSILGQGNWESYVNGGNFFVQDTTTFEGAKALYNNAQADSLIGKAGTLLLNGRQAVYIKTKNRSSWGTDAGLGVKISKGLNSSGAPGLAFASVDFKKDGNVRYYDQSGDIYRNFVTYNDDEWTLLEVEWRSSDTKARYRVNNGIWTDWHLFANTASFTGFDYVNFDFYLPNGSGEVYIDNLY